VGAERGLAAGYGRMSDDVWLVAGLGNPGTRYSRTRHNAGYLVTDLLAARLRGTWRSHRSGRAEVVEGRLGEPPGHRVILARPRSFMNESGGPISSIAAFYKIPLGKIIAVHDELDLPFATVRVKQDGGDGGHNGVRSLRQALGSGEFLRVRIGIGRPPGHQDPADFVLSDFRAGEREEVGFIIERAADVTQSLVVDGLVATQNAFHP
jgi:PTH1 family peptidyl-tRNA hydrolase